MLKKTFLTACIITVSTNAFSNTELDKKFGVSAKLGTLGAGLDLTYKIKPKFNARLNLNKASADYDEVEDGIAYKGDLNLSTIGLLLDYHPFASNFRITGGLYNNNNDISASASDSQNAEIGGKNYNIDGTLHSSVAFKSTAPYLGLGWGNAVKGPNKWRFSFDAGVLFQGEPVGRLKGKGAADHLSTIGNDNIDISNDPSFLTELAKEEANLNKELEDFKAYPVISVGVSYRF